MIFPRSLECDRLRVHRNLLVALLLQFLAMLVIVEPYVTHRRSPSYNDLDWLCRTLLTIKMYGQVASIMWMFVEGLFLHSRLTCNVFDSAAPFKFYYSIGWGIPGVVLGSWCYAMSLYHHEHCWRHYSRVSYIWIIEVPMLLALLINLLFLINIVRILVTKLRTNDSAETIKIRKAIRATIILFQLLGITNLLVAVNPGPKLEALYMVTNAVLQSSQVSGHKSMLKQYLGVCL
ncbi:GPCR family 2 secretin-like [Trinorchestia longiramus]|nr:GPCR family 2 secretin-like [Trinorchestia longiramus]